MTDQTPLKTFPSVQGRCPACRGDSLFIGSGGYVTCSRIDCPNPSAADELLHGTHDVFALAERTPAAEAEVERLTAGEEPGGTPLTEPTPGQWLYQFNRVTAEHRINVIRALLRDAARGRNCFFMAHEGRAEHDRKAWVIVAHVRDVIADMENITGARHWARILRKVIDGEEPAPAPDTAATQATDPAEPPLAIPHDMATTLHRTLGQLLGDQDAQAIARLRALHREEYGSCAECTHESGVPYPCPTIRALDQQKEQPRV